LHRGCHCLLEHRTKVAYVKIDFFVIMNQKASHLLPKIFIFDLDNTLSESKHPIDEEMASLLKDLMRKTKVAVISGVRFEKILAQLIKPLKDEQFFDRLYIFPSTGGAFFQYKKGKFGSKWEVVYERLLSVPYREKILSAFSTAIEQSGFVQPEKVYGSQFDVRENQITFAALGIDAPVDEKNLWDADFSKRKKLIKVLQKLLPDFCIVFSGSTSIDVTPKDVEKSFAINQIEKILGIEPSQMVFVGDGLMEGGNDYSVIKTGVKTVSVADPKDTKLFIRTVLNEV